MKIWNVISGVASSLFVASILTFGVSTGIPSAAEAAAPACKGPNKNDPGCPGGGGEDPPPSDPNPAIAYVDSQALELFVMDADGGNKTSIVDSSIIAGCSCNTHPSWSADGSRIVFRGSATNALYTVNSDGTGLTQIHAGGGFFPAWSPAAAPG